METVLEDVELVRDGDDRSYRTAEGTLYRFSVPQELGDNIIWDARLEKRELFEVYIMDGRFAFAGQPIEEDGPNNLHVHASLVNVDQEYTDRLYEHLENHREVLKEESDGWVNGKPPANSAATHMDNTGYPEEKLDRVTMPLGERTTRSFGRTQRDGMCYKELGMPDPAREVLWAAALTFEEILTDEEEEDYWQGELNLPHQTDVEAVDPEDALEKL